MLRVVASREHVGLDRPSFEVTQRTVRRMGGHIADAQRDPLIQQLAAAARGQPDPLAAIWWWVKHTVKFRGDDSLILEHFGERDHFELLIAPSVLIRMNRPEGDCDDFTMLIAALALACGYRVRIVTLECDRRRPREYTHVYPIVEGARGWVPLDASRGGQYPGWQVPWSDISRYTAWTLDGYVATDSRAA